MNCKALVLFLIISTFFLSTISASSNSQVSEIKDKNVLIYQSCRDGEDILYNVEEGNFKWTIWAKGYRNLVEKLETEGKERNLYFVISYRDIGASGKFTKAC